MEPEDPLDAPPPSAEPTWSPAGGVADVVKKAVLAGVGALFLTEEGARKLARDWKLPKELISYVASQAAGAKTEVLRIVSDEVRRFLESETLRREFLKMLSSMAVEVKAEIRLVEAADGRVDPRVTRAAVTPARKRAGKGKEG
jgi:hypothetical protein